MNGCCYYEIAMQSFIIAATSDVGQMLQLMLQWEANLNLE